MKKKAVKKQPRVRVKKSETTAVGQLIRQLGGMGGGALGAYAGMPAAGAVAGNSLGAAISKWLGFGDYSVSTNSVVSRASTGIPMMHKEGQSVVIRHREFITTVKSSTAFTVQESFQLNPGNSSTFPWLSTIANSFQEYRFKGIVFHYIPTSGNAISGTSPSLGSVMLQTSYRSNDSPPSNKAELLNEYWSGESVPADTFAHPIECNPAENPFNVQYVRSGDVPPGDNQLFYDLGVTHLCTQGQLAANNNLGDLWVTYEVELKKPIVASNVTSDTLSLLASTYGPTATTIAPFAGLSRSRGNLSITAVSSLSFTVDGFRPGRYTMFMNANGVTGGNFGNLSLFNANFSSVIPTLPSSYFTLSSGYGYYFSFIVIDSTQPVTFTVVTPSFTGTLNSAFVSICPAAPDL